jgi:urease beta subunit
LSTPFSCVLGSNPDFRVPPTRYQEKIEIAIDGETKKVYLDDMPDRAVMIGAHLSPEEENELIQFLDKNKDVFAW